MIEHIIYYMHDSFYYKWSVMLGFRLMKDDSICDEFLDNYGTLLDEEELSPEFIALQIKHGVFDVESIAINHNCVIEVFLKTPN